MVGARATSIHLRRVCLCVCMASMATVTPPPFFSEWINSSSSSSLSVQKKREGSSSWLAQRTRFFRKEKRESRESMKEKLVLSISLPHWTNDSILGDMKEPDVIRNSLRRLTFFPGYYSCRGNIVARLDLTCRPKNVIIKKKNRFSNNNPVIICSVVACDTRERSHRPHVARYSIQEQGVCTFQCADGYQGVVGWSSCIQAF